MSHSLMSQFLNCELLLNNCEKKLLFGFVNKGPISAQTLHEIKHWFNTYVVLKAAAMLPVLRLRLFSEDFRVLGIFADCDIFGPFDDVGFNASIIRTPGEEGTVPENTSIEKKKTETKTKCKCMQSECAQFNLQSTLFYRPIFKFSQWFFYLKSDKGIFPIALLTKKKILESPKNYFSSTTQPIW